MKIKQIEQISDTEVRVTWGDNSVQVLQGKCAKTLLQMTEMKVGEVHQIRFPNGEIKTGEVAEVKETGITFLDLKYNKELSFGVFYLDDVVISPNKPTNTAKERVENELDELSLKCRTLEMFVISERFNELGYAQQYLLENQLGAMLDYEKCLKARLDCWDK